MLINHRLWLPQVIIAASVGLMSMVCAAATSTDIPADFQAVIFKKILQYDRTLQEKGKYQIAFLDSEGSVDDVAKSFRGAGFSTLTVKEAKLEDALGASVLYLAERSGAAKEFCVKNKILTITAVSALVQAGDASVGIRKNGDGKPEILVNLPRARAEGHELAADLLGLSTIIK